MRLSQRMRLQVAAADNDAGAAVARDFFRHLEAEVLSARSYRGKVLSREQGEMYSGAASGVKVHRLSRVARKAPR